MVVAHSCLTVFKIHSAEEENHSLYWTRSHHILASEVMNLSKEPCQTNILTTF